MTARQMTLQHKELRCRETIEELRAGNKKFIALFLQSDSDEIMQRLQKFHSQLKREAQGPDGIAIYTWEASNENFIHGSAK